MLDVECEHLKRTFASLCMESETGETGRNINLLFSTSSPDKNKQEDHTLIYSDLLVRLQSPYSNILRHIPGWLL